jgi:hypothetical protein
LILFLPPFCCNPTNSKANPFTRRRILHNFTATITSTPYARPFFEPVFNPDSGLNSKNGLPISTSDLLSLYTGAPCV